MRRPLTSLSLLCLALAATSAVNAQKPAEPTIPPFETAIINSNSWYGRFGATNCAWIDMGDGVLVIDTAETAVDAANLAAKIKETTKGKPIKWFVLTHLHADSNGGLKAFLPTEATVFVNSRVAPQAAKGMATPGPDGKPGKTPTVVGVSDRILLVTETETIVIGVPPGHAHTDHDLYAYSVRSQAAFVGDLLTPGRCAMLSDPKSDPQSWLTALEKLEELHPALIVATRGDASKTPATAIASTKTYIKEMLDLLVKFKKQNMPATRVSGELAARNRDKSYCPSAFDAINAQAIYQRMGPDGKIVTAKPAGPSAAPAKKP